jgi:MoCo/4Fe-4S cofactor protein with predicted Tat translocation signal
VYLLKISYTSTSNYHLRTMEQQYWKSLDELSTTSSLSEEYSSEVKDEFTNGAAGYESIRENMASVNRRSFISILSASMALAATGCRRPDHKIVPVVKANEFQIPGLSNYYTTVFPHGTASIGLVAKARDGRPVKLEGNENHIASMGSSSSWIQSSLLSLYDPDRMKNPFVNKGGYTPSTSKRTAPGYVSVSTAINTMADAIKQVGGQGKTVRILVNEHSSPSFDALQKEVVAALPNARFVHLPAITSNNAEANKVVLGIDGEFAVDYGKANVIVSIDSDFLGTDKNSVYNIRQFAKNRKPSYNNAAMNKLFVVEAMMSMTGMNADVRIKVAPEQFTAFLAAVAKEVGASVQGDESMLSNELREEAKKVAVALKGAMGKAVLTVGGHLPVSAHTLGIAINTVIGAIGEDKSIDPAHQFPFSTSKTAEATEFVNDLKAGRIGAVVFAGVNPMYSADAQTQELLKKVEHRMTFSLYEEETTSYCTAYVPSAHYLESWGDALAFDGSLSIQQPLVAPLNPNSSSIADLLLKLTKASAPDSFADLGEKVEYVEYLRKRWTSMYESMAGEKPATFDAYWASILRDGVVAASNASPASPVTLNTSVANELVAQTKNSKSDFVCLVTPSYTQYDGTYSNSSWNMELPDPVTKMTWDNAALVSQKTAAKLLGEDRAKALSTEYEKTELVRLKSAYGVIELPLWIQPGMQDGVIATTTGFGRSKIGQVAENVGANAFALMGAGQSVGYIPVSVELTGKKYKVATTQKHSDLMGRKLALETTFAQIKAKEEKLFEKEEVPGKRTEGNEELPQSILPSYAYRGHRWGMTIDMSACVGCGACITACQAENNIPPVGKENIMNAREMHWIRIDRYYDHSNLENPNVILQPMLCQHCESAPCENVCPVAATTHSPEGLNEMTYNRCVGTKYCANNCPYKVRRFNWFNWHKAKKTPLEFVYNPEVTVRMRGVMEKCSFCTQRIVEARQKAKDTGDSYIQDGSLVTACQQACPASAIIFGNTNDANSAVSASRKSERGFIVLEELNVRPQITYLAKVRNIEHTKHEGAEPGNEHHSQHG